MDPTIEIFISSPVSGSEAAALRDIVSALRPPALLLVNFEVYRADVPRQIDFLIITNQRAELVELKALTAPVYGGLNGPWRIETSPGFFEQYSGANPWEQARDAKFALSDAMRRFAKQRPGVPKPTRRCYYEQFDASVTVYPQLAPGSKVCPGNVKAWVRSFPDTLRDLTSRPLPVPSTWDFKDWRLFATDYLGLTPATLASSIDMAVFKADQALRAYVERLCRPSLAPLLQPHENELVGGNVMRKLSGPGDVLLLGKSGLGKSFHLEHYRRLCVDANEVPVLLNAGYYRGDLNRAIHKSVGQFTPLTPAELLDAVRRLGMRCVLIVDGWNGARTSLHSDLGDDIAAFQIRYGARLVIASQTTPSHRVFGGTTRVELSPLRQEHKRAILGFHADLPVDKVPDQLCAPFSTAFDLSIAGRAQHKGLDAQTRSCSYDSYVRSVVPAAASRALLRNLAWLMGEQFKPVLPVAEYERAAEKLAIELGVPITIVDDLLNCRVLIRDGDIVAFEHDLLRDYFRAQYLVRANDPVQLAARLRTPKYSGLTEFIFPLITEDTVLNDLLIAASPDLLIQGFRGWLGSAARTLIRAMCRRLLAECRDQLAEIDVKAVIGEMGDGRRFVSSANVTGSTCVDGFDGKICAVIADNLDDPDLQSEFLDLLEIGERALKEASARTGHGLRIKPSAIWGALVHWNVLMSPNGVSQHPLFLISQYVRQNLMPSMRGSDGLSLRNALLSKARDGKAGALSLLLLMSDLRYRSSVSVDDILAVASQAWGTSVPIVKDEALEFLHASSRIIRDAGPSAESSAISLLEQMDTGNNIMLSTQWLEARSCFSGFETGIDVDSALAEFRRIIAISEAGDDAIYQLERKDSPTLTFPQFLARWAHSTLSKMFEDVFQGVYFEAYEILTQAEKKQALKLALGAERFGLFTSWFLSQLIEIGCEDAQDVLIRYGSRVDHDSFSPQDSVEAFVLANETWARIDRDPIPYVGIDSLDHKAWAIVGELIFWFSSLSENAPAGRQAFLCDQLLTVIEALPDVLRQISQCDKGIGTTRKLLRELLANHKDGVRAALHQSLNAAGQFTSVFQGAEYTREENLRWTISCLGDIGTPETVALIRPLADSATYGRNVIRSIEQIETREAGRRTVSPSLS